MEEEKSIPRHEEQNMDNNLIIPMDFSKQKEIEKASAERLANEWIQQVTKQKVEHLYVTDWENVLRCMAVRIKWKMTPNFSLWAEGLDPVHRHHWIAIDPDDSSKNFFNDYDLQHKIPDPVTREAAVGEPKYGTRLQRKWEYSILATSPRERILERKRLSTMKDWDNKVDKANKKQSKKSYLLT